LRHGRLHWRQNGRRHKAGEQRRCERRAPAKSYDGWPERDWPSKDRGGHLDDAHGVLLLEPILLEY
jgi:hypothetical protein